MLFMFNDSTFIESTIRFTIFFLPSTDSDDSELDEENLDTCKYVFIFNFSSVSLKTSLTASFFIAVRASQSNATSRSQPPTLRPRQGAKRPQRFIETDEDVDVRQNESQGIRQDVCGPPSKDVVIVDSDDDDLLLKCKF